MIYPSEGFDATAVLEAAQAERATALYGVPTMFIAELNHPDFARYDLSSLRTGIMAGSPCPVEVMKQVKSAMHMSDVAIAYGMTETSPVSTQTRLGTPLGEAGGHGGAGAPARRDQDRRSADRAGRARRASRASCARAATA